MDDTTQPTVATPDLLQQAFANLREFQTRINSALAATIQANPGPDPSRGMLRHVDEFNTHCTALQSEASLLQSRFLGGNGS